MCICGLTGPQRAVKGPHNRKTKDNEPVESEDIENNAWFKKSSFDNLADVYEFHCGSQISKDDRKIFVEAIMSDVRQLPISHE